METFGNRLLRKRREAGLSQEGLASKIGVSGPTINNWENGITRFPKRIDKELLEKAARVIRTNANWLLEGGEEPEYKPEDYPDQTEVIGKDLDELDEMVEVAIPVLDLKLSAGPGSSGNERPMIVERVIFQRNWLQKNRYRQEDLRILTVEGESMKPVLWPGDKVVVNTAQKTVIDGRTFAIALGDDLRIKKLFWKADGSLRIVSVNDDKREFPDELVDSSEALNVVIIGQVVHKMGNGGL